MSATPISPFDDDEGLAFVARIVDVGDEQLLVDAVDAVFESDFDYIDHGTAVRALIACECFAAQRMRESGDVPDELQGRIEEWIEPSSTLTEKAQEALRRILWTCEHRGRWDEISLFRDWPDRVESLLRRLD